MGRSPHQRRIPRQLTTASSPNPQIEENHDTDDENLTTAQRAIGDFAPKLVELTDVLFGDVWERQELSKRDRSLITVAALVAGGNTEQLRNHLLRATANGLTETELKEVIIRLAFYAGWPRAMSAINIAKATLAD
jgi:4-carboxymuconolactone decarboxylase